MNFLPTVTCFFSLLCFSIIFCLSSSHWFGVWLGLELNMLSFIVLIMNSENLSASESSIKYFLLQALGSGLFLFGFILSYMLNGSWGIFLGSNLESVLILSGLGLKLGCSPFHFWVPSVMNCLSWSNSLILSTAQKVVPLLFLIYLCHPSSMKALVLMGGLSALVGGLGGMNQSQARALLGYSSISHIGWMVSISLVSLYFSLFYFIFYLLSVIIVFWFLSLISVNEMKDFQLTSKFGKINKNFFFLSLLSLGGLPPLLGFFPKMMALSFLSEMDFLVLMAFLILGSLMSLFFYLNMFFSSYVLSMSKFKHTSLFLFYPAGGLTTGSLVLILMMGFLMMELLYM